MKKFLYIGLTAVLPFANVLAEDISNAEDYRNALINGEDISLTGDIELNAPIWLAPAQNNGKDVIINGNGHTVFGGDVSTLMLDNRGTIKSIENISFSGFTNDKDSEYDDNMGAVIRNVGTITKIDADFSNNKAFDGAAIFNGQGAYIGSINSNFTNNSTIPIGDGHGQEASGAAIFNQGHIGNITGNFSKNTGYLHGTIWGYGDIDNITAVFDTNYRSAVGGNGGNWKITNSQFLNNTTWQGREGAGQAGAAIIYYGSANFTVEDTLFQGNSAWWKGGAIAATGGKTSMNIARSKFINNSAGEEGGAIYTNGSGSTVNISDSLFQSNHGGWSGGAIHNENAIYTITNTEFDNNYNGFAGVIFNGGEMTISDSKIHDNWTNTGGNINSKGTLVVNNTEIYNNKAEYNANGAYGAGVYITGGTAQFNGGSIHDNMAQQKGGAAYIAGGKVTFANVEVKDNKSGQGGAIHSLTDVTLAGSGEGKSMLVSGNNAASNSTGVFMETAGTTLYLSTTENGTVDIHDIVDGNDYNLQLGGDLSEKSMVNFYNDVKNVNTLVMANGGSLHLAKDQVLSAEAYRAENSGLVPQIILDIEPDFDNNTITNGVLKIDGDVKGDTNVVVRSLKDGTFQDYTLVLSPFVEAPNDDQTSSAAFNVTRFEGSVYKYETRYNVKGDEEGSVWYLAIKQKDEGGSSSKPTPKPDDPFSNAVYTPEIPVYEGAMTAAVEQNRYIGNSIARGLKIKSCCGWEPDPRQRLWVDAAYETAKIGAPSKMDADISVFTVGLDLFRDYNNRFGILGGYRHGKYDFSGNSKHYSDVGSELKTDSWLGGVYYEYSYDDWRILSSLFGGQQKMDISTDDHVISTETDATQYGVDINVAKTFMYTSSIDLEPSLGIFYTNVDVDDIKDKEGKTVKFENLNYGEVELGVKAEYLFCRGWCSNRLYVKPSIIRTFSNGGTTRISGLSNGTSYKDKTLGRIELGGEFALSRSLQGYVSTGHTFGDEYKSYDINAGINYAW